jgi:septal ring factor EnvC (AmiA/AmiB activator)
MTRSEKILGFTLVAIAGVWGCSKAPESANPAKSSSLESKAQRLEEDFRAAAAARDQFRERLLATEEKLAAAETRNSQVQSQFDDVRTQRDVLKADLQTRTSERDNVMSQYEGFRKNLKNLLGQAETALNTPTAPAPVLVGSQPPTIVLEGAALRN